MVRIGIRPDDHTFPFVLKACADKCEFRKGMEIHGCVFKHGFDSDVYVNNTLLLFYGNVKETRYARIVFDEMHERDIVSWNTIIGAFSVNGFHGEALDLFKDMNLMSGFKPNVVSVVSALPLCAGLEDFEMTEWIHCYVVKAGLDSQVTIGNALIDAYGKCRNVKASKQVFREMVDRNEVSWNAVITSLAYTKHYMDALDVLKLMIDVREMPNSVAISSMLPVLVELELFRLGKELHGFCLRMVINDLFIANSLIDLYSKSGNSTSATNVFRTMNTRNVVSWNAMIANCAQNKVELEAVELLRQMQAHGEIPNFITFTNVLPACSRLRLISTGKEIHARTIRSGSASDLFVSNALSDMYAKCGCLTLASNVFDISLKDEVSYNILIIGYSQSNECLTSLKLFSDMGAIGMKRDVVSFMGALSACSNQSATKQGREIHGVAIRKHLNSHLFVSNSLLDFYTKSGRIDLANKIFDRIPNKDVASWNTMVLGYGMLGEFDTAINLFEAMKEDGVEYDSVSYIAVLTACSHGGQVEKGKKFFEDMKARNIKFTEMHYACMVDLLGRAGLMEEAAELIKSLPIIPDTNIWGALLGASKIHGNIEYATWAAEHLFELKPQYPGYYLLLSNMYAEAGKYEDANRIRELMKSRGARKNPGCSWVQVQDQVHAFVAGEKLDNFDPTLHFGSC
ncbi:pentatricopeptide repeat-containing protein At1g18485-like [Rutidosis leptorrhynchoides]|uniref:pentatricopeptide repeat-containing protein At1g18485-like n=1 Tax=Rutidosis leptorrhynchoides TaxID=125765 RepID=UPI003A9A537F